MSQDDKKLRAAQAAMSYVKDGMKLGLGTGSTAARFVDLVGAAVKDGLNVLCVPTSEATRAQAEGLGIPLTTLEETSHLDLTVDGADELDDALHLIKGGGGALLREKIVAMASDSMVVIADDSKHVETLGQFPLPVEVVPFGMGATLRLMETRAREAGCEGTIALRQQDGKPFVTDGGNRIYDCAFGVIPDAPALAAGFETIPGVVEHGLFIGIASVAVVADDDDVRIIKGPAK